MIKITTMRYHLTSVRMIIIKKSMNQKCWRGFGEKGTFLYCWWECKLMQSLWRTVWSFLKNLRINLSYDPANPLLSIYLEKTITEKDTYTPVSIVTLFTIGKIWKQHRCPLTDECIKKMWYIYTMEYYSVLKK